MKPNLKVVHPSQGETLTPDFTAFGLYQYPGDLFAVVIGLTKLAIYPGKVCSAHAGTWYCAFFLHDAPPGDYLLAIGDPNPARKAARLVLFKIKAVREKKKKVADGSFPHPSYPQANGSFHSDDIAYGSAPNCTLPFNSRFTINGQQYLGMPLPVDPTAPAGYWQHQYMALPLSANGADFHINDTGVPSVEDDEAQISIIADGVENFKERGGKKKTTKKGKVRKKKK